MKSYIYRLNFDIYITYELLCDIYKIIFSNLK